MLKRNPNHIFMNNIDEQKASEEIIQELWDIAKTCISSSDLAKVYATVHNECFLTAHEMDNFGEGAENQKNIKLFNEWKNLYDYLSDKVLQRAMVEKLLDIKNQNNGLFRKVEPFMNKYGYCDGNGWWKKEST